MPTLPAGSGAALGKWWAVHSGPYWATPNDTTQLVVVAKVTMENLASCTQFPHSINYLSSQHLWGSGPYERKACSRIMSYHLITIVSNRVTILSSLTRQLNSDPMHFFFFKIAVGNFHSGFRHLNKEQQFPTSLRRMLANPSSTLLLLLSTALHTFVL